jgi:hypothetical protein
MRIASQFDIAAPRGRVMEAECARRFQARPVAAPALTVPDAQS